MWNIAFLYLGDGSGTLGDGDGETGERLFLLARAFHGDAASVHGCHSLVDAVVEKSCVLDVDPCLIFGLREAVDQILGGASVDTV